MESTTFFDFLDYSILIALVLISIFVLIFFLRKTKIKFSKNPKNISARSVIINFIIGILLLMLCISFFVMIEKYIDAAWSIFKPISIMTSEPIVMFSIALFLIGLILVVSAIHRYYLLKKITKV